MKQLSHTDAIFVYNETTHTPLHISPILIYDTSTAVGGVRFKDILARFEERIHKSPVFRQKLVKVPFNLDSPYWINDDNFDLEFHVRHLSLPKPGDWRQFCILLARLHSRQLDLNRPPWEAYIIEGLDNITGMPPGAFAMYMKIHQRYIDNLGHPERAVEVLLSAFEPGQTSTKAPPVHVLGKRQMQDGTPENMCAHIHTILAF